MLLVHHLPPVIQGIKGFHGEQLQDSHIDMLPWSLHRCLRMAAIMWSTR